jgi:hypothetical protein
VTGVLHLTFDESLPRKAVRMYHEGEMVWSGTLDQPPPNISCDKIVFNPQDLTEFRNGLGLPPGQVISSRSTLEALFRQAKGERT